MAAERLETQPEKPIPPPVRLSVAVHQYGHVSHLRSRKSPCIRDSRFGCVASEGGAPFVARRAVNPHGCALPHCAPPPAATPPDPPVECAFRPLNRFIRKTF